MFPLYEFNVLIIFFPCYFLFSLKKINMAKGPFIAHQKILLHVRKCYYYLVRSCLKTRPSNAWKWGKKSHQNGCNIIQN